MKDKRFDDIVAEKLNSYGSPVPADMWERIHQQRKKRRFFIWWLTGGGIAAGIVIFYLLTTGNHSREKIIVQQKTTSVDHKASEQADKPSEVQKTTNATQSTAKTFNIGQNYPKAQIARTDEQVTVYHRYPNRKSDDDLHNQLSKFLRPESNKIFLQFDKPRDQKYNLRALKINDSSVSTTFNDPRDPIVDELQPWFAELFAGPAIGFKKVEVRWLSPTQEQNQNTGLSWQAGMLIGKHIGKRWTLKSGILYTSIRKNKSYDIDSVLSIGNNVAKMIDFPVIAGYQLGNGKLKVSANVGVIVNIATFYANPDDPTLRKNIGVKSYSGISVLYPAGEKIKLYVEPFYIHHFGDISRNRSYFTEKLHEAGISLGLRYTIDSRQHY